ncbi:MAG: hypothetical protein ABII00_18220 [Elusimicrobiota bacterium]
MKLIAIQVRCSAGYKAGEAPLSFHRDDRWVRVEEVLERWCEGGREPRQPISDYFRVMGDDGRPRLLKRDRGADEWYLVDEGFGRRP